MYHAIYTHAPTAAARFIRAIDGGLASHVGIGMPDGGVWDVTLRHGVKRWDTHAAWMALHGRQEVGRVAFQLPDPAAALTFLQGVDGAGYDVMAALGIGLFTNLDDPRRWFCSELLVAFAKAGGMQMPDDRQRVGPRLSMAWVSAMRPAMPSPA